MNICAVRTFSERRLSLSNILRDGWLPHEPESEHRHTRDYYVPNEASSKIVIVEAVCKHCGSIYREEK